MAERWQEDGREAIKMKEKEILEILKELIGIKYKIEFYNNKMEGTPMSLYQTRTPTKEEFQKIGEWLYGQQEDHN